MKKLLVLVSLVLTGINSYAQTQLWGMTTDGGPGGPFGTGLGAIFKTDGSGNNESVVPGYLQIEGANPNYCSMLQASDGKLYGLTEVGGAYNMGVIYQYNPSDSSHRILLDFNGTNGKFPDASLIQASDGMLYGMARGGGANNLGIIFRFDPVTSLLTDMFDFAGTTTGQDPFGSLMQASDGKLYGMTTDGGLNNLGVLFRFDPATSSFSNLLDFAGAANGSHPYGSLMQASDGRLYGMTNAGGVNDKGVLFRFDPASLIYTNLVDFDITTTGGNAFGALIQATNGKLYGMTDAYGPGNRGVLFQYDISSSTFSVDHNFAIAPNGASPQGSLFQASDGLLYGTTSMGGVNDFGTIFRYDPNTSAYTQIYNFTGSLGGANVMGSIIQATNGKMYGTTWAGGEYGKGIFYEFDPSSLAFKKRIVFGGGVYGSHPYGSLVQASDGKLYGMTQSGGAYNFGVIFQLDPGTLTFTKKIDFDGPLNGNYATGSMVQASDGMLYGMTEQGGVNNFGILFRFDPVNSIFTKLIDFDGTTTGKNPLGSLIQASDGMLYGTTSAGGATNQGVLFQFDPVALTITDRFDFDWSLHGGIPKGSLIQATDGKIYGMTWGGGLNGKGIIFQFDPVTSVLTDMLDFAGTTNGSFPSGSLIQATDGKLYGLTLNGGINSNCGVLFQFDPVTSVFVKKVDFNGTQKGQWPYGSLVQASDGNLYGMTNAGGTGSLGVFFQFNPTTSVFTKKLDFFGPNGRAPVYNNLIEIAVTINTAALNTNLCAGSSLNIPYTISGSYNAGNIFTAELSDASGSFASPVTIGTLASTNSGTINAIIPSLTNQGSAYRIRVVSSNPVITGSDNGSNISINPSPTALSGTMSIAGCNLSNGSLSASFSGGTAPYNYVWLPGNISSLTDSNIPTGTYSFIVTDANNCIDSTIMVLNDSCSYVWPGDANEDAVADNNDILSIGIANGATGTTRANATLNWIGQSATNWNQSLLSGTDYKYVDCDGNGIIDPADTIAVIQNFGLTHTMREGAAPVYNATLPDLKVTMNQDTIPAGSSGSLIISLGNSSLAASNIYGLAFTLNFDATQIDAATFHMNENGTWMGIPASNLMGVVMNSGTGTGSVQIAITRLDHINANGFGTIANLSFMTTNALVGTGLSQNVDFTISNLTVISANEVVQSVNMVNDSVIVSDPAVITGVSSNENFQNISVYPNPFDESTQIILPATASGKHNEIVLTDLEGRIIRKENVTGTNSFTLQRENLEAGIYFCTVRSEGRIIGTTKIFVK